MTSLVFAPEAAEAAAMPEFRVKHVCDWRCETIPGPGQTPEGKTLGAADSYRRIIAHGGKHLHPVRERRMRQVIVLCESGRWQDAAAMMALPPSAAGDTS